MRHSGSIAWYFDFNYWTVLVIEFLQLFHVLQFFALVDLQVVTLLLADSLVFFECYIWSLKLLNSPPLGKFLEACRMSASSCLCKCLLLMFVEGLVYWPGSIHQPAVRLLLKRHLFGVSKFIWWQNPLLSRSNNDSNINRYVSPNQRASWDFIAFREKQNKL